MTTFGVISLMVGFITGIIGALIWSNKRSGAKGRIYATETNFVADYFSQMIAFIVCGILGVAGTWFVATWVLLFLRVIYWAWTGKISW